MSLFSCKSGEYKFIWAYLGSVLGTLLLLNNVNIYLCLIFCLVLEILRMI